MPTDSRPDDLAGVLRGFTLGEVSGWDFWVSIPAGVGGGWLGYNYFATASASASTTANLVGVVIGAVVAALAIIAAFMGQEFLRKLDRLDRDPIAYLGPFLFTAVLGVVSAFALILVSSLPATAPRWLQTSSAAVAAFFTTWTLTSLVRSLSTLVAFVRLQAEAAQIDDDQISEFKRRSAS